MKKVAYASLFVLFSLLFCCGGKDNPTPDPTPAQKAPTAITLSQNSFSFSKDGGEATLTVKAPFRPSFSGTPSWITVKDGTFDKYQITYTLTASANTAYEERTATVTLKATGVSDVTFTVSQEAAEKPEEPTPGTEVNQAIIDAMGLGWNMGNQFDGYYNGSWAGEKEGYPDECVWQGSTDAEKKAHMATQATFDGLKALGFTSVRIPISWLKMIGAAPDYSIDESWMNRIYEVVGFAHNAGLMVIINTHHDENHGVANTYQWLDILGASNNSAKNETIKAEIKAVWTQIANKFKDCEDWLIMEGFNELNDGGWGWSAAFKANPAKQCNILNEWNQVFVDAVRATGGNNATRWLGVPTYAANPEFEKYVTLPDDPAGKTMLAVHFYDPSDYTIGEKQYSDWGHTGAADKKANGGDEDHVKAVFGNLYTKYVSHGTPVYLGEFGCSMRAKSNARAWAFYKYYMEYVVKAAKTYGLPCYLWDNGTTGDGQEKHGYVHHGTGQPIGNSKEIIDLIKKAWSTESAGYTLETVYNSAPKF